jgi:hypothetical protein
MVAAGATGQPWWSAVGVACGVIWIVGAALVSTAAQSILVAALYLYASEGTAPPQFDAALLQSAFGKK